MNFWKEPFNTYYSSIWIFSLFLLLSLLSIGHYRSFPSAVAILFKLVIQKSSSSYKRIKNAKSSSSYEQPEYPERTTDHWQTTDNFITCGCESSAPIFVIYNDGLERPVRSKSAIFGTNTRSITYMYICIKKTYKWGRNGLTGPTDNRRITGPEESLSPLAYARFFLCIYTCMLLNVCSSRI
jgi:hypothetical protein